MKHSKIRLTTEDIDRLHQARNILDKKETEHTTIDELSRAAGLNRKKLTYGFKLLFETGVYEYQVMLRMKKAKNYLSFTEKPVKVIAILCGYNSNSTFSIAFKRHTKYTPLQWRNKSGEKER